MENIIKKLLQELVGDPGRPGLKKTPARVAESLAYLTSGYKADPRALIKGSVFKESYDEMVVVKDIPLYSLCEHHLLPFFGKAHVAYLPDGRLVGISKISKMVDIFARRLQVQERLTQEIASTLQDVLKPRGVAVIIEARHLCMEMRGERTNPVMMTSTMLGGFRKRQATRDEFMSLIGVR